MRVGERAASRRKSAHKSWSSPSTIWTRRWLAFAAPKCQCPMRSISRRRLCPRSRESSMPLRAWCRAVSEFLMPQLGADMSAGKLLGWRKSVGDRVQRGDIIADVETEKADIEVEVFASGVIEKFLVQPGAKVPVGTVLAIIREEGKPLTPEELRATTVAAPEPILAGPVSSIPPFAGPAAGEKRLHISPAARKLAADLGVDPASLTGTGPGGRITLEDIQRAGQTKPPQPAAVVKLDRPARMRQAIAAAMARSKREIPHYY